MKIAGGDYDLGPVAGDALDPIAPAADGLDRGLDRLRPCVHGQRGVEPGELAKLGQEWAKAIIEEGARRHGKPLRLRFERGENARMGMAVAGRGIGAHHVDVTPPRGVPEMSALPARQHDRQRLVIASAVSALELHGVHGTSHLLRVDSSQRIYGAAATSAAKLTQRRGGNGRGSRSRRRKSEALV